MPGEAKPNSVTENTASLALDLSRRDFVATVSAAAGGFALAPGSARAATVGTDIANLPPYGNGTLPPGIRSRSIANVNGLTVHILEAGYEVPGRPAVLLLHGFPELAYSWRKVMLPLAAAEYHVDRPRSAGLWPHHWLGRLLRRRSRSLPHPQHGPRCHGTRVRARLSRGGGRGWARCWLAGRGVERAHPAGCISIGDDDEFAVRGRPEPAVQHREPCPAAASSSNR